MIYDMKPEEKINCMYIFSNMPRKSAPCNKTFLMDLNTSIARSI